MSPHRGDTAISVMVDGQVCPLSISCLLVECPGESVEERRLFTLLCRRIMMCASHGLFIMGELPAISESPRIYTGTAEVTGSVGEAP